MIIPDEAWRADWRNRDAYPPADSPMSAIAWEVRRRQEAYARDFASLSAATENERAELDARLGARWGLFAMLSPVCSDAPSWRRAPALAIAAAPMFTFAINLAEPITRQMDAAREDATQRARDWRLKHQQVRGRGNKVPENREFYIDLLRVLDGIRAGVDRAEIRRILWPHLKGASSRNKLAYMTKRADELMRTDLAALAACDIEEIPGSRMRDAELTFETVPAAAAGPDGG
jgi:hypothetical protein